MSEDTLDDILILKYHCITQMKCQFKVHAYNEESSSLLRNEVVHSPTLTNRSGMDNPQAVNVLPGKIISF